MAGRAVNLTTLRGILSELRLISSDGTLKNNPMARYVLDQYRKYKVTEMQLCHAEGEMKFVANTYLCYLRSLRKYNEIRLHYKGKGERSVTETAHLVGFKLPHDPK